jgi:hypothetical protein
MKQTVFLICGLLVSFFCVIWANAQEQVVTEDDPAQIIGFESLNQIAQAYGLTLIAHVRGADDAVALYDEGEWGLAFVKQEGNSTHMLSPIWGAKRVVGDQSLFLLPNAVIRDMLKWLNEYAMDNDVLPSLTNEVEISDLCDLQNAQGKEIFPGMNLHIGNGETAAIEAIPNGLKAVVHATDGSITSYDLDPDFMDGAPFELERTGSNDGQEGFHFFLKALPERC